MNTKLLLTVGTLACLTLGDVAWRKTILSRKSSLPALVSGRTRSTLVHP